MKISISQNVEKFLFLFFPESVLNIYYSIKLGGEFLINQPPPTIPGVRSEGTLRKVS